MAMRRPLTVEVPKIRLKRMMAKTTEAASETAIPVNPNIGVKNGVPRLMIKKVSTESVTLAANALRNVTYLPSIAIAAEYAMTVTISETMKRKMARCKAFTSNNINSRDVDLKTLSRMWI
ncbi:MAG: hypothetical protein QW812_04080 [Thermoplasmataceae archaeon]